MKVNSKSQGEGTFLKLSGDDQKVRCISKINKETILMKVNSKSQGEGTFLELSEDDPKVRCVP